MSKRPDRAKKRAEKKDKDETVVKACLRKLLYLEEPFKTRACELIEKRVVQFSKRVHVATIALNLLVRELFWNNEVTSVDVPVFWDQTFLRQLMLGLERTSKPDPTVQDMYERHPNIFPLLERSDGDSNIYTHGAKKLSINIKNHLRINLPRIIKRYIYHEINNKDDATDAVYATFGWKAKEKKPSKKKNKKQADPKASDAPDVARVLNPKVTEIPIMIRGILGFNEGDEIDDKWLKKEGNLIKMLRLFVHINRLFEAQDHKLFSILPLCRIKPHFITIDTSSMVPLLKELGLLDETVKEKKLDKKMLWDTFIKVNKVKTTTKTFTGTIDTDGVAINVHFERPKSVLSTEKKPEEVTLEGKRIIAVDPGRKNIFTMVDKIEGTERFKERKFTRAHYYKASGITTAIKKTNLWNKSVKNELEELSRNSPKTVNLERFMEYVTVVKNVEQPLWDEYFKRKWRNQTLRLYGGKKRTFANFFNTLGLDDNTVVAYGSAKFAPTGKGEVAVPTSRAYKEFAYRAKTVLIDEFRTTMVHCFDDSILQKVAKRKNNRLEAVRGLLWCNSTISNKFVNRDMNAAINIWRCAKMYPERPLALSRRHDIQRIVQPIGRIIPF